MALRGRRINNFIWLWYLVASGGLYLSFFWKLVDETQMSKPPEATRHHNSTKLLILLPLRAIWFRPFQYDTPCTTQLNSCQYPLINYLKPYSEVRALLCTAVHHQFGFCWLALMLSTILLQWNSVRSTNSEIAHKFQVVKIFWDASEKFSFFQYFFDNKITIPDL